MSIPAIVLAETVRGKADDAPVTRVVKAVGDIIPVTEQDRRVASSLLGLALSNSTVDAVIIAMAVRLGRATILTGDPDDLRPLATGYPNIQIQAL